MSIDMLWIVQMCLNSVTSVCNNVTLVCNSVTSVCFSQCWYFAITSKKCYAPRLRIIFTCVDRQACCYLRSNFWHLITSLRTTLAMRRRSQQGYVKALHYMSIPTFRSVHLHLRTHEILRWCTDAVTLFILEISHEIAKLPQKTRYQNLFSICLKATVLSQLFSAVTKRCDFSLTFSE